MKIPRWTVYPALAVIGTLLITAVPKIEHGQVSTGAAKRAREALIHEATAGKVEELKLMGKLRTEEIMAPAATSQAIRVLRSRSLTSDL
jgi:hypothetical protein